MNTVLWKQFESNLEKRQIWRTTRNLSPSARYTETPITVHYEDSDKGTVFGIDILYYPEERDDKGEQKKLGITCQESNTVEST